MEVAGEAVCRVWHLRRSLWYWHLYQINGIATAVQDFFDPESAHVAFTLFGNDYTWATVIGGLVVTLCVALVVLGGIQRIAKVSEVIVPLWPSLMWRLP